MKVYIKGKPDGPQDREKHVEAAKDVSRKPVPCDNNRHRPIGSLGETMLGVVVARKERDVVPTGVQCKTDIDNQPLCSANPQIWVENTNIEFIHSLFFLFYFYEITQI